MAEMAAELTDARHSWTGFVGYASPCRQKMLQFERGFNVQNVFVSYGGYPDR